MMFLRVNDGESEIVVKRSRFIAVARGISSRDEAKAVAVELKKLHRDARHVCYAFIVDDIGREFGYDDDGEPQGTAGKPIYTALSGANARRSMVAVVRYFGGIKLGAGGLTHAYRDSADSVIEKAGLSGFEVRSAYSVECDGDVYKKIQPLLRNMGCTQESIVYNARVSFTVVCKRETDVIAALSPLGATVLYIGERIVNSET